MRQLIPFHSDPIDLYALYGDQPDPGLRPAVRLNMIASLDGATTVTGVSGGLGGPADHALFAVLRAQADVVPAVDLEAALAALAARVFARVLAEGGPSLNGQLAAAGLIDEICLTLSPRLVSGDAKRILAGPSLPGGQQWRLRSLCEQDGFLFLRWRPA